MEEAIRPKDQHTEHSEYDKHRAVHVDGQVGAAHLYIEDVDGNVIERVRIPHPTNDPRDPLSWSALRRHLAFAAISTVVFMSNFSVATVTPGFTKIIVQFGITAEQASYLITTQILALGVGNLFWIPLSLKFGKRPITIVCTALFLAASIWSAKAGSYGSLLAARIIQGFGASASEALGPAVVADVYFLHERGAMIGIYTFMIASGSAFGGIFGGLAVHYTGNWRWAFGLNAILTGISFLLVIFFLPETNFKRPPESERGEGSASDSEVAPKRTWRNWVEGLAFWGYYDHETSLLLHFWRPVKVLYYPAVVWASLLYGVVLGWVVIQQTANATAFPELYNFSDLGVGNLNIASLIGAVLGCIVGGPATDWLVAIISKRKGGLFRPEERLYFIIVPLVFGPIGLMLWGAGLEKHLHWSVAVAGWGVTYGVLCLVPAVAITYVVDCYRPLAGETLTSMTAFKNTFAFGLSFGEASWIELDGYLKTSGFMTLIEGVLLSTAILMFLYGERLRNWTLKGVTEEES
ncbi:MFS transporter [Niveomyces insectorum RCEF 264]|uniref:MFS transporter n=1 Tax=Niveomyces insectorum RCEF 264 TaxID=1081102 RepID=A0A167P576_9HYPO|nr:MFS transporter [Niveomyces insectorum RCEF 264]